MNQPVQKKKESSTGSIPGYARSTATATARANSKEPVDGVKAAADPSQALPSPSPGSSKPEMIMQIEPLSIPASLGRRPVQLPKLVQAIRNCRSLETGQFLWPGWREYEFHCKAHDMICLELVLQSSFLAWRDEYRTSRAKQSQSELEVTLGKRSKTLPKSFPKSPPKIRPTNSLNTASTNPPKSSSTIQQKSPPKGQENQSVALEKLQNEYELLKIRTKEREMDLLVEQEKLRMENECLRERCVAATQSQSDVEARLCNRERAQEDQSVELEMLQREYELLKICTQRREAELVDEREKFWAETEQLRESYKGSENNLHQMAMKMAAYEKQNENLLAELEKVQKENQLNELFTVSSKSTEARLRAELEQARCDHELLKASTATLRAQQQSESAEAKVAISELTFQNELLRVHLKTLIEGHDILMYSGSSEIPQAAEGHDPVMSSQTLQKDSATMSPSAKCDVVVEQLWRILSAKNEASLSPKSTRKAPGRIDEQIAAHLQAMKQELTMQQQIGSSQARTRARTADDLSMPGDQAEGQRKLHDDREVMRLLPRSRSKTVDSVTPKSFPRMAPKGTPPSAPKGTTTIDSQASSPKHNSKDPGSLREL